MTGRLVTAWSNLRLCLLGLRVCLQTPDIIESKEHLSRVLYVQGTTRPGGAWESLRDIVFGLECDRFEPIVACSKAPAWRNPSDKVKTVVVKMPMFRKGKSFLFIPLAVRGLRAAIRAFCVSLVHANSLWDAPYALRAARRFKIPVVVHVRTEIDRDKARKYSLHKVNAVISTSRSGVETLSGFDSLVSRVFYLPNGVDLNRFNPSIPGQRTRRKCGIDDDTVVFGAVGRIDRLKGLDILVSAFARVAESVKQTKLLIVGEAEGKSRSFKKNLLRMVECLHLSERVVFAGHQNDPVPYLAAMDVLVMPSRTEGFGRSAVEAMAMAKPVIASDVGALPEIVSNGQTGYNFHDGDVDALAYRMKELASDEQKRATLGLKARALAEERFDLKEMLSRLQNIYGALLNGSEGR